MGITSSSVVRVFHIRMLNISEKRSAHARGKHIPNASFQTTPATKLVNTLDTHARCIDVCMARTHASSHTRKNTHLTTINSLQSVPRIDASAQVRRTAWLYAPDSDTLTTVISIEGHTQTAGPAGTKVARDTEVYTHLLYL
jgi:hypothetical protein